MSRDNIVSCHNRLQRQYNGVAHGRPWVNAAIAW